MSFDGWRLRGPRDCIAPRIGTRLNGRLLSGILMLTFVAPLPSASAVSSAPSVDAFTTHQASAGWALVKGRTVHVFQVAAARTVETGHGGPTAWAAVGRGKCPVKKWAERGCDAVADGPEIPLDQFEIDPALGSATLRFRYQGFMHRVRWRAHTEAGLYPRHYLFPTSGFAGAGVIIGRDAVASGRLFGKRLGRSGFQRGELAAAVFGFAQI
jgi:hypothetical protein